MYQEFALVIMVMMRGWKSLAREGIMQIGEMRGQAVVVCVNRDQGLVTPIFRRWPERFAWAYIHEIEHFVACMRTGKTRVSVGRRPLGCGHGSGGYEILP